MKRRFSLPSADHAGFGNFGEGGFVNSASSGPRGPGGRECRGWPMYQFVVRHLAVGGKSRRSAVAVRRPSRNSYTYMSRGERFWNGKSPGSEVNESEGAVFEKRASLYLAGSPAFSANKAGTGPRRVLAFLGVEDSDGFCHRETSEGRGEKTP